HPSQIWHSGRAGIGWAESQDRSAPALVYRAQDQHQSHPQYPKLHPIKKPLCRAVAQTRGSTKEPQLSPKPQTSNEFTIININDQVKGQPLKITEIPKNFNTEYNGSIPHLRLNSINLRGLHHIEDKILLQHPAEIKSIDGTLYHTTLPFYAIVLGAAVLVIAIAVRRYMRRREVTITTPSSKE
ncbi:Uncharacterized protein OBRU01_24758, partial [Operophtera brumata]